MDELLPIPFVTPDGRRLAARISARHGELRLVVLDEFNQDFASLILTRSGSYGASANEQFYSALNEFADQVARMVEEARTPPP